MKMHYSVWGYQTACGKHLSGSRWLVRNAVDLLTCETCIKAVK